MNSKKAFITVSFGSTFAETRLKDIGGIEKALQEAFPAYDHFSAFTSSIVRRQLAKEDIFIDDPDTLLEKLVAKGYTDIFIQPTHLLHGEEFEQKILVLRDKYAACLNSFVLSKPLITDEHDYPITAAAVAAQFPVLQPGEGIVLMGHGSPRKNNKSFGFTYLKLQEIFDKMQLPVVVGTVEDEDAPNFDAVLAQLSQRKYAKVHMFPLMVVAGDHANNDMYGDEEDSWKTNIEKLGIQTEGHLYGLGRNKAIQSVYIHHALETIARSITK